MEVVSDQELPWTGERVVPSCSSQLLYEHLHRYAIAARLAEGKRVVDIACGEGYGSNLLAATAAHVIAIDIAPEVIAHARKKYGRDNLTFQVGSCLEIPLDDHTIDLLVSFETIEHIDDHFAFLREIKRVLAPEGTLIISSPDKAEYSDRTGASNPFHKRELYHEEFHLLLRQHFKHCRMGKQKLVAGSWIAPDGGRSDDVVGTFTGDIHHIRFQPGVRDGVYSLALCSDMALQGINLGIYANSRESERIWDLLERFASPENIQNALASLERQVANLQRDATHKAERTRVQLAKLTLQLNRTRVQLAHKENRVEQVTSELRRQLLSVKKLTWFIKETEKAAVRLRTSRRWRIANPFAALRALLGNRESPGYGHLEKIISDFSRWRAAHPEIEAIDERLQTLEQQPGINGLQLTGNTRPLELGPPPPTKPIEFPAREQVEISIIIPVFNQLQFTLACLASIQEHHDEVSFEIIVVDDSSADGSRETLSRIPGLVYLRNEKNSGFIASCNYGATKARGSYLLFLNNDTIVTPGWLSALRETFDLESNVGLVGSKLIFADGRLQEAGGIIWRDGSGWNRGKFDDAGKPEYNYLCEVDYCSAACLMVPKSLFESVGGFDSSYVPAYYEDTDLAFKMRAAGLKVFYQPLSRVIHFEGATGGTDLFAGAKKYQEINRSTFIAKWAEALAAKPVNGDIAALERLQPPLKRVLVIDHHLPMPDRDSGSLRMFHILRILHQLGHHTTFIPSNLADIAPYGDELRKRGIQVIARPHVKTVREHLASHGGRYDAVILSRCATAAKHMADVRLHAPDARIIFDTVDLHFLRIGREAELTNNVDGQRVAQQTKQQEYALIGEADETWVVSELERDVLLEEVPGKDIEVVSNIVEIREPNLPFSARSDFLFIGSFLHPPNIDAVLFFVNDIYPLITAHLPDVKCYVVGHSPPPEVLALASGNIIVTGSMPDVRPLFESVKLSVAPIRYGAGVKGKINQSMGLGLPVVATSLAAEGMCLTHREDVLIADDPAGFAQCVVELYNSPQLWQRLSQNGLKKTRRIFSHDVAYRQLSRLFSDGQGSLTPPQEPVLAMRH